MSTAAPAASTALPDHPVKRELRRLLIGVAAGLLLVLAVYLLLAHALRKIERVETGFHAPALALASELASTLAGIVAPPGVSKSFVERLDSEAAFTGSVTRDVARSRSLIESLLALYRSEALPEFDAARARLERAQAQLVALERDFAQEPVALARAAAVRPLYATIVAQQTLRLHRAASLQQQDRRLAQERSFIAAYAVLVAAISLALALQFRRSLRGIDGILASEQGSLSALRGNMAALEEAQRLARLGNWEVNLADGTTWWSTGMYRLFERDPDQAPPSPEEFIGCVHPDDRARVRADIENPQAHLRGSVSQHRQLAADGSVRHMVANFRVDADAEGRPARLFGTLQDITEQVEADRRVRASQDQLAAVLAAVPDLWFVVNAERCFAEVSAPDHPQLAVPWSTLRGQRFKLVPPPGEPGVGVDALVQAREAGPVCSFEYPTAAAPGQPERAYEARIVAMPDGQWLYLSRDISERRRTEQALARNRDELEATVRDRTRQLTAARDVAERANRAKSEFLSRMSHELRTPMNAVLGFAQLLGLDPTLAARPREYLDHIMRGGKHLLHLINDVLDLAHVESGRMTLSPEPLPIDDILREVIALMKPLALQHGVTIEHEALADAVVRGDRLRVKQVLLNLLSNAIKYNRPGGWVRISGELAAPGTRRVVVADSGQGISPQGLAQLFEPFARLGAEHGAIEGTGIGLSITKRLVEMMGGAVGATSQTGVGSRFWIDLPTDRLAAAPAMPVEPALAEPAAVADSRPACVLYVEDNPANLALVQQIVDRHAGVRMIAAPSGALGFDLAISHRPDLVLLDIHLPDMSGHAVLQKLREHAETRTIPVVAVTANAMPDDAARAREAGFDEYMTKPIDIRRFDAMLQRLLHRRSPSPACA